MNEIVVPSHDDVSADAHLRQRYRYLVSFRIDGDLRFISHQDTLRVMSRALARANLPVRFSAGFNPLPKISLLLPRPVGVASDMELMAIEFDRPVDDREMLGRLSPQCPKGLQILHMRRVVDRERLEPEQVCYRLSVDDRSVGDLRSCAEQLLAAKTLRVERRHYKSHRVHNLDLRPYLLEVEVLPEAVQFTLRVTQQGTARPAEVAGLLGFDTVNVNHLIRRLSVTLKGKQNAEL